MSSRLLALAVSTLLLTGCGPAKLDVSKTYSVGGDTPAQGIELNAQSKPQTINIEFSSSAGEVSVYVLKKSDYKDVDDLPAADSKKAIATKKGKAETFTAEIPENTAVWVAILKQFGSEKSDVQIKINNKK